MSLLQNKPRPLESYTTDEGVFIYVFEQKYYHNILDYYDKNLYVRKGKTDKWFLLIKDPVNAPIFNSPDFEKNVWSK